jgi:hypothetical protein
VVETSQTDLHDPLELALHVADHPRPLGVGRRRLLRVPDEGKARMA